MKKNTTTVDFQEVKNEELKIIKKRRERICHEIGTETDSRLECDLVGLALSGGGIRSAITNLGVLQGLARSGIFRLVDLLSTVSGGGYIGGCLSSLLSIREKAPRSMAMKKDAYAFDSPDSRALFNSQWKNYPLRDYPADFENFTRPRRHRSTPDNGEAPYNAPFPARGQMRHLRNHSSYLFPRAMALGTDVLKGMGAVFIHTAFPLFWFISFMAVLTAIYMFVVSSCYFFHPSPAEELKKDSIILNLARNAGAAGNNSGPYRLDLNSARPSVDITIRKDDEATNKFLAPLRELQKITNAQLGGCKDLIVAGGYLVMAKGILLGLLLPLVFRLLKPWPKAVMTGNNLESHTETGEGKTIFIVTSFFLICLLMGSVRTMDIHPDKLLFIPSLFCLGALLGSLLLLAWQASCPPCRWERAGRSRVYLFSGIFLCFLALTLVLALLPGFILSGRHELILLIQAAVMAGIHYSLRKKSQAETAQIKKNKLPHFLRKIKSFSLTLLVPLFIFLSVVGIGSLINDSWLNNDWLAGKSSWQTLLGLVFCLLVLFLLISAIDFNRISHHFFYRDRLGEAFLRTFAGYADGHVVSARNAIDMPLSSLHGNCEDNLNRCAARGPYHLINATINHTASRDLAGFRRKAGVFLFSRCFTGSDRTGYVQTTAYDKINEIKLARALTVSGAAVTSVMGAAGTIAASFACTIFGVRLGFWLPNPAHLDHGPRLGAKLFKWIGLLGSELFRYTHCRGRYVYLSDGGHSGDNLGIIPLLRRRVKFIIASDAEHDPLHTFNSLNSSIRQAYVDHGIKIDLRISAANLELNDNNMCGTHHVLGRVLYPSRPWQRSWILILKNSLTGDEMAPLLNYRKKVAEFPHEITADQFFTEEQFESYRALGRHAAETVFPIDRPLFAAPSPHSPWSRLDNLCAKMEDESHKWDDIIRAISDAEQEDFSSWQAFQTAIVNNFNKMKTVMKMSESEADNTELGYLSQWLAQHESRFSEWNTEKNVPRTWEQFLKIRS